MLDHLGNPLFPDTVLEQYLGSEHVYANVELYLASEYLPADLDKLTEYGLEFMSPGWFLDKLKLDLKDESFSRVKSPRTDDKWHTCLSNYLTSILSSHSNRIRSLSLIPLIGGEWTSAQSTLVYFSRINNEYAIPTDLGLHLVDPKAERNFQRKKLFESLGVKNAQITDIRGLIVDKYRLSYTVRDLNTSRSHLNFIYLTARQPTIFGYGYYFMRILDHENRGRRSSATDPVYFSDDNPYGARKLFHAVKTKTATDNTTPELDVSFIHHGYLQYPPKQSKGDQRSWKTWLKETFNIYDFIPVFTRKDLMFEEPTFHLSKECLYIAKHHPEKFLGFLLENWRQDNNNTFIRFPSLRKDLLELEVICENGRKHPLGKTYLPITAHQEARKFFEEGEFFPWLRIEASLRDDEQKFSELQVLAKRLGFGFPKSDLENDLDILGYIQSANKDASKLARETRVYDLYHRIGTQYLFSVDSAACRQQIQCVY
jgi:hypothetical protein